MAAEPEREYTQEDVDKLVTLLRRALRRIAELETRTAALEEDVDDLQERVSVLRSADRYMTKAEVSTLVTSKINNAMQKARLR